MRPHSCWTNRVVQLGRFRKHGMGPQGEWTNRYGLTHALSCDPFQGAERQFTRIEGGAQKVLQFIQLVVGGVKTWPCLSYTAFPGITVSGSRGVRIETKFACKGRTAPAKAPRLITRGPPLAPGIPGHPVCLSGIVYAVDQLAY